jgi:hypothetical protein
MAAGSTNDDIEMARIRRERQAVEARHAQAIAACRKEFAVSACMEKARDERRAALEPLRHEQQVVDDARRREKAAQRARSIEQRQADADDRTQNPAAHGPEKASAAPRKSSATAAAAGSSAPASAVPHPSRARQHDAKALTEAARLASQRAAETKARRAEAELHRQEVLKRNAEQDRKRPPAAGLPPLAPASASH